MRERGLKSLLAVPGEHLDESLPMRERGLKFQRPAVEDFTASVAPHAGAWIEIGRSSSPWYQTDRRSPCGSVD